MRTALVLFLVLAAAPVAARQPDFWQFRAVQESLSSVHPRFREHWLKSRGHDPADYLLRPWSRPESTGLRLVGKWGRGPSVEVTGRDSLVVLTLGSEVALLNFADPERPQVLSEIQLDFMPAQSELTDTLLIVGGRGMEVWNVSDPARPARVSRFQRGAGDFCLRDSLVCFIRLDTFWVYSISNPADPRQLGCCRESGYVLTASGSIVVVGHPNAGLFFIDISNPALPRRVGAFLSDEPLAAQARGNLCCASFRSNAEPYPIRFVTLDISNPASVRQLGRVDSAGGYDIYLWDTLVFASGRDRAYREEFQVISVADSAHPRLLGRGATPHDNWGVWACPPRNRAYVADRSKGLSVMDISDLTRPVRDTAVMVADLAYDVAVDGDRAYVADYVGGLRILDVTDPTRPLELGGHDSLESACYSVVPRDSFAFIGWLPGPYFRTMRVDDPSALRFAAMCATFDIPMDMVRRDTLVYCAMPYRFQIVNIFRPRQPVLVGSCNIQGYGSDIVLQDTLAYVSALYLTVVDVARPDSPRVVFNGLSEAEGLDVVDTVVYLAFDGLKSASVADPTAPYLLDSVPLVDFITDVVVMDTLAVVGGRKLYVFSVADPRDLRLLGTWTAPGWCHKLLYAPPFIYAACFEAGVCIYETTTTGLQEPPALRPSAGPPFEVCPTMTRRALRVVFAGGRRATGDIRVVDVAGRVVAAGSVSGTAEPVDLDLGQYPPGVYWVEGSLGGRRYAVKVVKQ